MKKILLCTDLDRTLLPNGDQPESEYARIRFSKFVSMPEVTLVYVTGRDQKLVIAAIKEYELPLPNYVIANVGSTIYEVNNSQWQHQKEWDTRIAVDWKGISAEHLKTMLNDIPELRLQESEKQDLYKVSYYVALDNDSAAIIMGIEKLLSAHEIAANIIWSVDEQQDIGLLDILPASAGKRQAIEFLMHYLGFDYSNTIFAGDSGNDVCVLSSPIHSVLVANASDDVHMTAINKAKENKQEEALYIAHGGFLGMNGNYSAGILEGIKHYIPETGRWLEAIK